MSNRILDYPEATAITSDDYILLDNEGAGAKCIKASALNINMDNYTIKEARGAIASFDDGEDLPLAFMGAYITAIQEGSGDPSPTNIRPISGWDEANVSVSGVNVWDEEWELGTINDTTGQTSPSNNNIRTKNYIPVKPNTTYYKYIGNDKSGAIFYYDKDENFILRDSSGNSGSRPFTTPNNCCFVKLALYSSYGTTYNNDISINYPSTDTQYHAYNGATYTIPFTDSQGNPIEVYGGTLDVVSGVLTVDRTILNMGDLTWTYLTSGSGLAPYFYTDITSLGVKYEGNFGTVAYHVLCSIYKTVNRNISIFIDGTLCMDGAVAEQIVTQVQVKDSRYTSASDFKTAMNGVQLVYELTTPLTYQLSKQQIRSLVGENNIFASTGDSIVDYRKLWVKPEM